MVCFPFFYRVKGLIMKIAGIDIGTNTILMSIADYSRGFLKIIRDEQSIARLGQDLDKTGLICEEAIDRAVKILENYNKICKQTQVDLIRAAGTSALRDAKNSKEVIKILSDTLEHPIEIISGSEEAYLSFLGTIEGEYESIVVDIGGGSTEIIYGKQDKIYNHISLQLGAVRLTENFLLPHPPPKENILLAQNHIINLLNSFNFEIKSGKLYAVAGTPTTLAAISLSLKDFERDKVHLYELTFDKVNELLEILLKTEIEDIVQKFGVNPLRADVISAGALILKLIMEKLNKTIAIVSVNGLRIGLIKSLIKKVY